MTKEEVQLKSKEKVEAIQTLCEQLQVTVSAEDIITEKGFIKKVVYYTDTEKYNLEDKESIDKSKLTPLPFPAKKEEKTNEKK